MGIKIKKKLTGVFIVLLVGCGPDEASYNAQDNTLAVNGNTIFYNSPIVTTSEKSFYLSYLTSNGEVVVKKYDHNWVLEDEYLVYDYKKKIRKTKYGNKADDHAAPAISYSKKKCNLLLVTSYHGTNLHIFSYVEEEQRFKLKKTLKGHFTYPRIVVANGGQHVFVRKMYKNDGKWRGDLVVLSSLDDFTGIKTVIESNDNQCVYASRPFYHNDTVYFTWSIHDYDLGYSDGWFYTKYSLKDNVNDTVNLSYLVNNSIGNRPTAIAVKNEKIFLGTSYFESSEYFKEQLNFNKKNFVKIISVDNEGNVSVEHQNTVLAPYYGVDVDIDNDLNYIYFDKDDTYYNGELISCDDSEVKMYPTLFDNKVIYSRVNGKYRLRDFNTSLKYCSVP